MPLDLHQAAVASTPPALRERVLALQYRSTAAVTGSSLTSREAVDEFCATQLGKGWRMAGHHDHDKGWGAIGRDAGVSALSRFWVAINDPSGNCWDP